ncbi:hypothetical protein LCGC14_2131830 [marine sediment metagenome]|uniref:Uncharacterized protein n=1 Tax=marine sediment metagenome TaxID=412755 RepID=A0A0F9GEB3_9ZZZZ
MNKENQEALAKLNKYLEAGGLLKIITNMHACGAGKHIDMVPDKAKFKVICDAFEHPRTDPRHFVIHDAVRLEMLAKREGKEQQVRVHTAERDHTTGQPVNVLKRLLEVSVMG